MGDSSFDTTRFNTAVGSIRYQKFLGVKEPYVEISCKGRKKPDGTRCSGTWGFYLLDGDRIREKLDPEFPGQEGFLIEERRPCDEGVEESDSNIRWRKRQWYNYFATETILSFSDFINGF